MWTPAPVQEGEGSREGFTRESSLPPFSAGPGIRLGKGESSLRAYRENLPPTFRCSACRHDPLAGPRLAELEQSFLAQDLLCHPENDAVLEIEFLAGEMDDVQQAALRFFESASVAEEIEPLADRVMFMLNLLELAHLVQPGLKPVEEQFVLQIRMTLERRLEHSGHGLDLSGSFRGGDRVFQMIQLRVEHSVFGDEGVGDFHVWSLRLPAYRMGHGQLEQRLDGRIDSAFRLSRASDPRRRRPAKPESTNSKKR